MLISGDIFIGRGTRSGFWLSKIIFNRAARTLNGKRSHRELSPFSLLPPLPPSSPRYEDSPLMFMIILPFEDYIPCGIIRSTKRIFIISSAGTLYTDEIKHRIPDIFRRLVRFFFFFLRERFLLLFVLELFLPWFTVDQWFRQWTVHYIRGEKFFYFAAFFSTQIDQKRKQHSTPLSKINTRATRVTYKDGLSSASSCFFCACFSTLRWKLRSKVTRRWLMDDDESISHRDGKPRS